MTAKGKFYEIAPNVVNEEINWCIICKLLILCKLTEGIPHQNREFEL